MKQDLRTMQHHELQNLVISLQSLLTARDAEIERLKLKLELSKPVYSRRQLKAQIKELREFVEGCVDKYFSLPVEHRLGPKNLKESEMSIRARQVLEKVKG